jgi:hypothetical protein
MIDTTLKIGNQRSHVGRDRRSVANTDRDNLRLESTSIDDVNATAANSFDKAVNSF